MARRAVVIGSNGPAAGASPPLKYALADARRLAQTLSAPNCGFVVELIDGATTPNPVRDCIERIADECRPDNSFLVTFSGHGIVDRGMLLMLDQSSIDRPLQTMLHADDIVKAMRFCRARHKLMVLDCCHAGGVLQGSAFRSSGEKFVDIVQGLETSAADDASTFAALLASDRLQKARELDALGGSFFTHEICEALGPSLTNADRHRDGAIDLEDLKWWLETRAADHNRRYPENSVPTPYVYGRSRRQFYLTIEPSSWIQHMIKGPNETELLVLPARVENLVWCIGRTPVTNDQYRRFVQETNFPSPVGEVFVRPGQCNSEWANVEAPADFEGWRGPFEPWRHPQFNAPDQPVVCVSFEDAKAYSDWLTQAAGNGGVFVVTPLRIWNIAAFGMDFQVHDRLQWSQSVIHDKAKAPASVSEADGRTTPFGAVDMLGNVWEWCSSDVWGRESFISLAPPRPPWREATELRGGSYLDDLSVTLPFCPVSSIQDYDRCRHTDLGFRIATTIDILELPRDIQERVLQRGMALGQPEISYRVKGIRELMPGGGFD